MPIYSDNQLKTAQFFIRHKEFFKRLFVFTIFFITILIVLFGGCVFIVAMVILAFWVSMVNSVMHFDKHSHTHPDVCAEKVVVDGAPLVYADGEVARFIVKCKTP